jgi:hypothetical protein
MCDRQTKGQPSTTQQHTALRHAQHHLPQRFNFFSGSLDRVFLSREEAKGRGREKGAKTVKFAFLTP